MASTGTKKITAVYTDLKKQAADIQKKLKVISKIAFKEMSAEVFKANPTLVSFGWSQCTPYFNDGDACVFSAASEYPSVTFKAADGTIVKHDENYGNLVVLDENDDETEISDEDYPKYQKQIDKLTRPVVKFLGNFDDDDFLAMFDDHKEITVNRNGKIEVNDYEHD